MTDNTLPTVLPSHGRPDGRIACSHTMPAFGFEMALFRPTDLQTV